MSSATLESIAIRPFRRADAPACSAFIRKTLCTVSSENYTPIEMQALLATSSPRQLIENSKSTAYSIAMYDKEVPVGIAGWAQERANSLKLYTVFVDPSYRGQGIGSALLDKIFMDMRQEHWSPGAIVNVDALLGAESFYKANGFWEDPHGQSSIIYQGTPVRMVQMLRLLHLD